MLRIKTLFLVLVGKVSGGKESGEEMHRIKPGHAGGESGRAAGDPTAKPLQTGGQEDRRGRGGRRRHHERHDQIPMLSSQFIHLFYLIYFYYGDL